MAVLSALALENPMPVQQLAPDVPRALAEMIMKLLAKDPADRPATANEVVGAIHDIEREAALPSPQSNRRDRGAAGSRRRLRLGAAAGVLLAVVGPVAWFLGSTIIAVVTGVSLKRGGKEAVHVKQQASAEARDERAKEMQALAAVAKDKPFVIVRAGERFAYKTFAEALAQRRMAEAIEVHSGGPFSVPATEVNSAGLILRAAARLPAGVRGSDRERCPAAVAGSPRRRGRYRGLRFLRRFRLPRLVFRQRPPADASRALDLSQLPLPGQGRRFDRLQRAAPADGR